MLQVCVAADANLELTITSFGRAGVDRRITMAGTVGRRSFWC
jgi:hypothetical protein